MIEIHKNKTLENLPGEIWLPIPIDGYSELFLVSNLGRLKKRAYQRSNRYGLYTTKEKILTQTISYKGYCVSDMCIPGIKKSTIPHRMVAMAFKPNINPVFDQVNHINGIKTDNRVENLEWCNNSINIKHAWDTGLFKPTVHRGADDTNSTLIMHTEYGTFYSIQEVSKIENINRQALTRMVEGARLNTTKYVLA